MSLELNGTTGVSLVQDGVLTDANMPAGSLLQVVSTTYNTISSTTSGTWLDLFSLAITPSSSTSKILVVGTLSSSHINNQSGLARITRDGTAIGGGVGGGAYESNVWFNTRTAFDYYYATSTNSHLDSPATTSAVTYKFQIMATNGAVAYYINRSVNYGGLQYDSPGASSITLMEIAA